MFNLGISGPFLRLYDPHHLNHFSLRSLDKIFHNHHYRKIKILTSPVKMKYTDYPYNNFFIKYFYYIVLSSIFFVTNIVGYSHLQTVVFQKKKLFNK